MTLTDKQFWHYEADIMDKSMKEVYNMKHDFLDVSNYVERWGKTTLTVPESYHWKKEIFAGIGKVNIYIASEDNPFLIEAESFRTLPAERMKCPNALSKYIRFHEQGTPSAYEIDYKEGKFYVTKLEVDENDI